MSVTKLLIANRGEIAIRVGRAAADLGIATVAVFSEDDAASLHLRRADEARPLRGSGVAAYLDVEQIIEIAKASGCDAVHPGYGFLSESAAFARRCAEASITFVGPRAEVLEQFGDKGRARAAAARLGVPVLAGADRTTSLEEARAFFTSLGVGGAMIIKAMRGGGGRGMRVVERDADVDDAYERCRSEAQAAFGNGDLYVEQFLPAARHIEVQIVGDGSGAVSHIWERDCSIQRRHQKLIEIAPSPHIDERMRAGLTDAAVRIAQEVRYDNVGTFEFLVESRASNGDEPAFFFIEANARLQVEHTVTEELTGIDLVRTQIEIARGRMLRELGVEQADVPRPRGYAIEARVNMESIAGDGAVRPSSGTLRVFEPPTGPGIRVDTFGYAGYETTSRFDSLLAKVIVRSSSPSFEDVVAKATRALGEFRIEGVATNVAFLRAVLAHPEFVGSRAQTRFVDQHAVELAASAAEANADAIGDGRAGSQLAGSDPLAILAHGKSAGGATVPSIAVAGDASDGMAVMLAPMQGTIIAVDVAVGDAVRIGQRLFVMEAMKMEHVLAADASGYVHSIAVSVGDAVIETALLATIEPADVAGGSDATAAARDPNEVRADLAEVRARHAIGLDAARPDAVARRRKTGQRTTRENIEDLCDDGSFVEYGPMVIAAQRRRHPVEELIERTPADGLVAGIGRVNGDRFDDARSRVIAMSYDYTVLAGTQGQQNHRKKDRMFELAETWRLPIVFFTEGGGGRPGDTDGLGVAGLDCMAFSYFGKLSGLVPLVGITSGRCFAGNAALLGCCDVVIATAGSNIGMGGPAMIEGGGLGVFRPEDVGPMDVQVPNGVVDIAVANEAEAVAAAKRYLSYFQGLVADWACADQSRLREIIPENRRRVYDVRAVIEGMADVDSVLELRPLFGAGMVTALARVEGRPIGIIANNPMHLAGAIDSDGADKAARFMQLCDAFDIPLLFLCDTPGIMVGPDAEKTALVRHAARMFVTGASVTVPFFTIVLRKAYGLGAQAMAGGSFKAPFFTISWPTGEYGGMGLEGAVKLGYRNELAAIDDAGERTRLFDEMVERMYQRGKAVNTASHFEIDDVIDPADSRQWIMSALRAMPPTAPRTTKKRPAIDTW